MEPNSIALVVVLLLAAGGALFALVRFRFLVVRIVSGALALVLAAVAGMAIVNDYYGYYQTWSQLSADLNGSYASFTTTHVVRTSTQTAGGRLESVALAGASSGITRQALVYLPPQYFEKRYAHTTFPVVELLHGTPGSPSAWVVHLDIVAIADQLMAKHQMGPMILVMPTMSVGRAFQECVNAPGALDDTYITQDVRSAVEAKFRVSRIPAEWGIAGYSSGGYCAANLALRHRASFGASAIMDGYYRPQDGPAAAALHFDAAAEAANDPLQAAAALQRDVSPLPAFWISAGSGDRADMQGALAFTAALRGVERVPMFREPGAGHNFYAWQPAVPHMLAWMWQQLASPQLRVQFPIAGPVERITLRLPTAVLAAPGHRLGSGHTHVHKAASVVAHGRAGGSSPGTHASRVS